MKKKLISCLKNSYDIFVKNWKRAFIPITLEILFLLSYGFFASPLIAGVGNNLLQIGDIIVNESSVAGKNIVDSVISSAYFSNFMILSIALLLIVYILYSFFQGFVCAYSIRLKKKINLKIYVKRFFKVNIFWYSLFVIYVIIDFVISYFDLVRERYGGGGGIAWIFNIILVAIIYFAFINYTLLDEEKTLTSIKKSFGLGTKKILSFGFGYLFIALTLFILNLMLSVISTINTTLFVLLGIVLVMPILIFFRVLLKELTNETHKN